jgi:hypothetical protein
MQFGVCGHFYLTLGLGEAEPVVRRLGGETILE